jgi:hypothetical protein
MFHEQHEMKQMLAVNASVILNKLWIEGDARSYTRNFPLCNRMLVYVIL